MQAVHSSTWAFALAAVLTIAGCASTGGAGESKQAAQPSAADAPVPVAVPADAAPEGTAARDSDVSPLVRPGQDPALAGKGLDIRAMPPGFEPLPPDLEERVEGRWKLLIAGEGEKAYDYLTAGVRSSLNRDTYAADMRSRPVRWVSADALDAQCEASSCATRVLMTIKFSMQSTGVKEMETQSAITERWIRVGEEWFHIPDQYLEGFAK